MVNAKETGRVCSALLEHFEIQHQNGHVTVPRHRANEKGTFLDDDIYFILCYLDDY